MRIVTLSVAFASLFALRVACGAVLWDEAVMGELSDDFASPTAAGAVSAGSHAITGSIGPGDVVDALSFDVPVGSVLTTFFVRSFPPGNSFSSAPFSLRRGPGDFSEVIEFGNYVFVSPPGYDLLAVSSMPGPQGTGTYALSVGHPVLGEIPETRTYLVEFTTAAVPEPSTAALCLCAGLITLLGSRSIRSRIFPPAPG